jgi:hypothetical protein
MGGEMTDVRAGDLGVLRSGFEGAILVPGDDGYDGARAIWNGAIDRRPAVIAQPATVASVAAAVRFAQEASLEISVRAAATTSRARRWSTMASPST